MSIVPIYMPNQTHVISPFDLCCSPTILSATDTLQECPLPSGCMDSTSINPWLWTGLSLSSTTYFMTNSLLHVLLCVPLSLSLNGKTLALFLSIPSSIHQVVPIDLLPILGKDAFLAEYLPKEVLAGYWNDILFLPPPNHTLCNLFSRGPTFPTLDGLQVGGALAITSLSSSSRFVFSFPMRFLPLLPGFVL